MFGFPLKAVFYSTFRNEDPVLQWKSRVLSYRWNAMSLTYCLCSGGTLPFGTRYLAHIKGADSSNFTSGLKHPEGSFCSTPISNVLAFA